MISYRYTISLMLVILLGSSCSRVAVNQDYDTSASFSGYTRFSLEQRNRQQIDPLYEEYNQSFFRIIKNSLQDKGFSYQDDSTESDFIFSFTYTVRPVIDIYNISRQMGFSYGSYNRYGGIGAKTCTDISEFDRGILIIDIKDSITQKLVWRGTGADTASLQATPEEIDDLAKEMVTAVLQSFPPE